LAILTGGPKLEYHQRHDRYAPEFSQPVYRFRIHYLPSTGPDLCRRSGKCANSRKC